MPATANPFARTAQTPEHKAVENAWRLYLGATGAQTRVGRFRTETPRVVGPPAVPYLVWARSWAGAYAFPPANVRA